MGLLEALITGVYILCVFSLTLWIGLVTLKLVRVERRVSEMLKTTRESCEKSAERANPCGCAPGGLCGQESSSQKP